MKNIECSKCPSVTIYIYILIYMYNMELVSRHWTLLGGPGTRSRVTLVASPPSLALDPPSCPRRLQGDTVMSRLCVLLWCKAEKTGKIAGKWSTSTKNLCTCCILLLCCLARLLFRKEPKYLRVPGTFQRHLENVSRCLQ